MIADTALDVRRIIDFLQSPDTVDSTRLGSIGSSLAAREGMFYRMQQVHQLFAAIPLQAKEPIEINGPDDMPAEMARHWVEFLAARL